MTKISTEVRLYDSLSKRKQVLQPVSPKQISLYVCGVTVYDYCHVGHARVLLIFDCLRRCLEHWGYQVTYIRNITDIDDKIIQKAQATHPTVPILESVLALTAEYTEAMQADLAALSILPPSVEPRATQFILEMIALIEDLLAKSFAYIGDNGDVYFSVSKYPSYGALSHRKLADLRAGERVQMDPAKRDPLDFVLWKKAKPGEVQFPAPFGAGRPGWHIECSAMALANLAQTGHGQTLDIHGGGHDLQFPHHENERAQSEAQTGCCFSRLWMHVGFVNINQEKMSKSLNNFVRIRDCLALYHPEVLRYAILSTHYRSPLAYSDESMSQAKAALSRLYRIDTLISEDLLPVLPSLPSDQQQVCLDQVKSYQLKFETALADDLNTPLALSTLFEMVKQLQRWQQAEDLEPNQRWFLIGRLHQTLISCAQLLGLRQVKPEDFLQENQSIETTLTEAEIERHLAERARLRSEKRFKEADAIRDWLFSKGVTTLSDKKIQ